MGWIFPPEERYVRPAYNTQSHGAKTAGKGEQEFPRCCSYYKNLEDKVTGLQGRKQKVGKIYGRIKPVDYSHVA